MGCSPVLAIYLASYLDNHYCVVIFVQTRLKAVNVSQVLSASDSGKQRKNSLNLLHINFNISLSALRQFWKGHQLWFTLLYVEEYSTSPSSGRRQRCVTETGIKKESTHIKALDWLWFLGHDQGICFANYCHHIIWSWRWSCIFTIWVFFFLDCKTVRIFA